ncbi:MAG TPA: hypothetical protein VGZ32_06250 [Actinocrinis sp.]|jgi:hypothetical protein|uniref:hypothetical protein n=1 Tax=Actinocrinis sp. TaxID=1920516 RepID=UPI002DDDA857|nr:hypothetical protein [Actinocrinis sp.]HEV3169919.1 hypothetical protein [Actinocrinis sp.]
MTGGARVPGPRKQGAGKQGLAVIPGFAGRRSVVPFAILVLAVLGTGLVILLLLNTALDRGAFELNAGQKRQSQLTDEQQQLALQLGALSAPGPLASQAAALGMVPNPQPAFLNPGSGAVLGSPSAAPTTSPPAPPSPTPSGSPSASGSPSVSGSPPSVSQSATTSPSAPATGTTP